MVTFYSMSEQLRICVLGAGIVGLHAAVRLQRDFPLARVTVIAAGQVHQTTSIGAAGIFLPGASFHTAVPQMKRSVVQRVQMMVSDFSFLCFVWQITKIVSDF